MAIVPVTGWNLFLLLPLRNAWTKRKATGIKPMAITVLARGTVVLFFTLLVGEFAVAN